MSKEIKEKCKECVYYNEKQQYPDVEGAITHLNCLSLKCQYRKITKDVKITRLESKIADLEAKLAQSKMNESFEKEKKENAWKFIEQLKQQLAEKDKEFNWLHQKFAKYTESNQDKISFAVERLVNIQKYITDNVVFVEEECFGREINEFIDNQIEELKKEMM